MNRWGRKRLAYAISKKTTGYYVNIEFDAPGSMIALLERSYQLDELILRYLTIRLSKNALKARAQVIATQQLAPIAEEPPAPVLEVAEEKGEAQ
jgi:ribosomal protein S6